MCVLGRALTSCQAISSAWRPFWNGMVMVTGNNTPTCRLIGLAICTALVSFFQLRRTDQKIHESSEVMVKGFQTARIELRQNGVCHMKSRGREVPIPICTICNHLHLAFGLRLGFNFAGISAFATCKICSRRWSMASLPRRSADNVLVPIARQSRDVC